MRIEIDIDRLVLDRDVGARDRAVLIESVRAEITRALVGADVGTGEAGSIASAVHAALPADLRADVAVRATGREAAP